jgi:homoserine kinase
MNHKRSVTARAGATVANIAVGFDILGLALEAPFDQVTASHAKLPGVRVTAVHGNAHGIPLQGNTASRAVEELLTIAGHTGGIDLILNKGMPVGSGLGSSAASAAAAVVATQALLGTTLSQQQLISCVQESERMTSGAPHADNAAPAICGGIVLIQSYHPLTLVTMRPPAELAVAVVRPHIELKTEHARRALSSHLSLSQHSTQSGYLAGTLLALERGDYELLKASLKDIIVEPQRAVLIPGFYEVQRAALEAGALGSSISGAGPSIFALCRGADAAHRIGSVMCKAFAHAGIVSDLYAGLVNTQGARVDEIL